jgi:hypothetical protein
MSGSPEGELDLNKLDSVSRPIDVQGELKKGADGIVKANKYKSGYNGNYRGRLVYAQQCDQNPVCACPW